MRYRNKAPGSLPQCWGLVSLPLGAFLGCVTGAFTRGGDMGILCGDRLQG